MTKEFVKRCRTNYIMLFIDIPLAEIIIEIADAGQKKHGIVQDQLFKSDFNLFLEKHND